MLARLVVGALAVPCADRCACHADGNDAGAWVREVGGACCRRGWHGLVAVLGGPALPGCPARTVGAGGVRGLAAAMRAWSAALTIGVAAGEVVSPAASMPIMQELWKK